MTSLQQLKQEVREEFLAIPIRGNIDVIHTKDGMQWLSVKELGPVLDTLIDKVVDAVEAEVVQDYRCSVGGSYLHRFTEGVCAKCGLSVVGTINEAFRNFRGV